MDARPLIQRLFSIEPEDVAPLRALWPLFAATTGSAIVVASVAKAMFLSTWPLASLPWVFVATGLATALGAMGFVALVERVSLRRRWVGLLGVTAAVYVALAALWGVSPRVLSWVVVVGCPGLSALVAVQTWNIPPALLPTRQAKRLAPVLAAAATGGACVGGGLVPVLLSWLSAVHLLGLAGLVLVWPAAVGFRAVARLAEAGEDEEEGEQTGGERGGLGQLWRGVRAVAGSPVLWRLSLLVFAMQVVSVVLDYQFSGELPARFGREEMASFLGGYYWLANGAIFAVSLLLTTRAVRWLGIGIPMTSGAVWVLVGSAIYMWAGAFGGIDAFAVVVGMAFGERVSQFAFGKSGVQMLVSPLDPRRSERARTLIDGVVYRVATIAAAVMLLWIAPEVGELHWLSPLMMVGCLVVIGVGVGLGPHYRAALYRALERQEVDRSTLKSFRRGVGLRGLAELRRMLRHGDGPTVIKALEIARTLELSLDVHLLGRLAARDDPDVAVAAMDAMRAVGRPPDAETLVGLLDPGRHPAVLARALDLADEALDPTLRGRLLALMEHEHAEVAAHAAVLAVRLDGLGGEALEASIAEAMGSAEVDARVRGVQLALRSQEMSFMGQLNVLSRDPSPKVRRAAVEAMGKLALPIYVDALLDALARPSLRSVALAGLRRCGDVAASAAASRVRAGVEDDGARAAMVKLLEGGSALAVEALEALARSPRSADRTLAVAAIDRGGMEGELGLPWVEARAAAEIDAIAAHTRLLGLIDAAEPLHRFFREEVEIQRREATARAFRLLGVRYGRDALRRAERSSRSPSARARSNAIELLDEKVQSPALSRIVALIERRDRRPSVEATDVDAVDAIVDGLDAHLERLWAWVREVERAEAVSLEDPMGRLFWLSTAPLFASVSAQQLGAVAEVVDVVELETDAVLIEAGGEGDRMFLIVSGRLEVLSPSGAPLATLGAGEVVGELALLDGAPRSATVRAIEPVQTLALGRDALMDLLDRHPSLSMAIMRTLSRRLREA